MPNSATANVFVRRIWFLLIACFVAMFAPPAMGFAAKQDTGYIQVQCEPGLQIFLDGVLKGVSNRDQDGLVIEDVPVGTRVVKAVKPGFVIQEQRVTVGNGEIVVLQIELRPRVGSVVIKSLPVECTVTLERSSGGGWDSIGSMDKSEPEARVSKLEIGTYRVTASRSNGTLSKSFELAEYDEVTVFFNFVGKTAEVSSAAETRRVEEARRAEEAQRAEEAAPSVGIKYASENSTVVDLGSGVSMRLVEIKPGTFTMGSASRVGRSVSGLPINPAHEITINHAFSIAQTEVTQSQWAAVMGSNPSCFQGDPNRPVEQVSWNDAQEFCSRLSKLTGFRFRLPSESEWEYACRAGTGTEFPFGDNPLVGFTPRRLKQYAWYAGNSGDIDFDPDMALAATRDWDRFNETLKRSNCRTRPVALKNPNPWGLYDMQGNVSEWCEDLYDLYPGVVAPAGMPAPSLRVVRGGSYNDIAGLLQASRRSAANPETRDSRRGFRVVRTD